MCGIAGMIAANPNELGSSRLKQMTDIIAHRGPDGEGQWISPDGKVGLGHRRLAIIDLSEAAAQPMHYMDRYSITFNGEIYNYVELKELCEKQGYRFASHSDTEVIMALYDWKKEACLSYFDGMFALVIYDAKEQKVFAARDRFGEKPFYYYHEPGKFFAFASEMKALWAAGVKRELNKRMLYNYMAFKYVDNPADYSETFFSGITRLPHSHYILIDIPSLTGSSQRYWDINKNYTDRSITMEQAAEKFRELFYTSVSRRLRSDVPVGSSLSGGLDSSAVVAVIDDLNKTKGLKQSTFSAIFPGFEKDESHYIHLLLKQLNVDPHFTSPDADTMLKELNTCFYHQEEPFGSASILAQYEVLKLAKQNNVTVLLDGQGADELLAGYHPFYQFFFKELKKNDPALYTRELAAYRQLQGNSRINPIPPKDLKYYARKLGEPARDQLKKWRGIYRQWTHPYFNAEFFQAYSREQFIFPNPASTLNEALYNSVNESMTQLLRYADRNSMAHSREVRLPFLSHELVEFLFSLPAEFKIHEGWTKYIQRKTFEPLLPEAITWRKDKIGYEPPQKKWMEKEEVKDRIRGVRKELVSNGVLHKNILNQPAEAAAAHEDVNNNWNHLMLSYLI
ncbi:MAG: asparagine synthase (glutamine-hydrolyzing) [Sphingobacteriales bacterium]|nr:asparagine synthase (glutamine-hydrolyzing) [Sphingobacteriales bacterium]